MSNSRYAHHHARLAALMAALSVGSLAVLLSCSSDPPSPLGSEGDLIGSTPGTVYQDTISVYEDMVVAMNTLVAGQTTLEFGRQQGYERAMILQPGFAGITASDTLRTVESATLRLTTNETGSYPARFYTLAEKYTEGSAAAPFDTVAAIVDPETGSVNRTLQSFPRYYPLPPALVQEWIRDRPDSISGKYEKRVAMGVYYDDALNDRVVAFVSEDADKDRPRIEVTYAGTAVRDTLYVRGDATAYRDLSTTSNLIVSDGVARRVYFLIHLDELADNAAVHTARVRLHLVPGTVLGTSTTLVIYIPESTNPAATGFKSGQLVTEATFKAGDESVEFTITNAVFLMLQGTLPKNGFVLRFQDENTELRQVEFYGSAAADSLRPRVYITSSTPAVFNP